MTRALTRRSFVAGAAAGLAGLALSGLPGCAAAPVGGDAASPRKLTVLYNDAPTGFDPVTGWDGWYAVCRGLTETLTAFDENMQLTPLLATGWENVDALTWRFTVRTGVAFHSGAALTPEAVKASLERSVAQSTRAAKKIYLDRIDVDGDDLVITTQQPVATLPGELAEPVFSIVDVNAVETSPANCGTGPYEGDDCSRTDRFTLRANEAYWQGRPACDRIECRTITDPSSREMGLRSAEADVAASLLASSLQQFRNDDRFTVLERESARMVFMYCNERNDALANANVRRALSCAVDRETLASKLLQGAVAPNGAPFPRYLPYSQAVQDEAQSFDPDEARRLLAESGWNDEDGDGVREKDGRKLSLRLAYYASRPELPLLAPALQDAFKAVGVSVEPQLYENVDDILRGGDFDLALYNTTTVGNGDPSYYLGLYFASDGSENFGGYANDGLDAVVAQLEGTFDQDERSRLAERAERIILDDCAAVFIGTAVMNAVEGPGVAGYELAPVEYYGITAGTERTDG